MLAGRIVELFKRAGLIEDIYGRDGRDLYLRRWHLTPRTRVGQLVLHVFFRGDQDPDPHDHPWDFWTLPLSRNGYIEMAPDEAGDLVAVHVPGWCVTHRRAEYAHLIVGRCIVRNRQCFVTKGRFATLVWMGQRRREWGFWPRWIEAGKMGLIATGIGRGGRVHVSWYAYLFAKQCN